MAGQFVDSFSYHALTGGTQPKGDAQIVDNCKTQGVQMNRVLKAIVLSFILTGITWQAVAFNEADLQKLKSSLK